MFAFKIKIIGYMDAHQPICNVEPEYDGVFYFNPDPVPCILNDEWIVNLHNSEKANSAEWKNTSTNKPPQGELVEVKRWDRKTQTTVIQDAWLDFNDCWTDETDKIIKEQYVKWWRYK